MDGWSGQKTEENKLFYVPNSLVSWVCSVNLTGWLVVNVNMRHHYKRIKHASSSSRIFYLFAAYDFNL